MDSGDGSGFEHGEVSEGGHLAHRFVREQRGDGGVWHSKDEGVGVFFAAGIKLRGSDAAIFDLEPASGGAQVYFAAFLLDGRLAAVVEFGERYGGNAHAVSCAVGEEGFPENVDAVAGIGFVELFIERTDEHDTPEALDGTFGLVAAAQPVEHGDAPELVDVPGAA